MDAEQGARTLSIGSGECVSVNEFAEMVQRVANEELREEPESALVENPREFETVVPDFTVETETAPEVIGFEAERSIDEAVRSMFSQ
jgi:nucleoside-diphosphate-sugar epimerase